jgi:hypothetical protein
VHFDHDGHRVATARVSFDDDSMWKVWHVATGWSFGGDLLVTHASQASLSVSFSLQGTMHAA